MTIAFDAKRAFHNFRGLGNYSRDYLRLAAQYASENRYLLFNPKKAGRQSLPQNNCFFEVTPKGIWQIAPALWRTFGCTSRLKELHTDIFHGLSGELPMNIHKTTVSKVVTVHDAIFLRYPELYSATYRALFAKKVRYACRVADVVIAISEQTRRDCIELLGAEEKKVRVMYQGCSNLFRKTVTEEEKKSVRQQYNLPHEFLLDVGAIEPRKNLKTLLEALFMSKLDIPLVVIGGESQYARQMKRLAASLHLKVIFLHNVPFTSLPAIYQSAHALVYPSFFEGFGIPILEALCSNLPVLTSTGSCFAETGGDAALYADPHKTDDIAEKLRMLVFDDVLRRNMIERGTIQAAKFTDDIIGNNIHSLYQSLCK